jgi:catechol 2,3-dioxygenase-like lactoylglutathione lyase family enzyme
MADERPVFNQVNLVVRDMAAMLAFYERLGVEVQPTPAPWDRHHRTISTSGDVDFDLDSSEFTPQWNGGWPAGQTGAVLGFRVASREAVDAIYDDLAGAGYRGQQPPYDAFWGARYALVADPDGNTVGIMSPIDPSRQAAPPEPGSGATAF